MNFPLANANKDTLRAACKKCGYAGHLTYQCRNFLKVDPNKEILLDVESTSSDSELDYLTPLTELRAEELKSGEAAPPPPSQTTAAAAATTIAAAAAKQDKKRSSTKAATKQSKSAHHHKKRKKKAEQEEA
ncbi:protein SREK1IP1 [Drosophila tropicalis]|uniref:protein SREK1IP1 n=1 Tax=Drosophila tropicalis TaxID=46794 RepID=UPI0035ABBFF4